MGSVELESIATWIKGIGENQAVGILLQELIGRVFDVADFALDWALVPSAGELN